MADRSSFSTLDLSRPQQRARRFGFALAIGGAAALVAYAIAMMVVRPVDISTSGTEIEFVYGTRMIACVTATAGIVAAALALVVTRRR
ncbi:MAG TPA: hypothetical protein VMJ10_28560 [Kofleriaceae bacterium]|nr:hypothetical protein [Kofleriaceae bacterium]